MLFLILVIASNVNDSIAGEQQISPMTPQEFMLHRNQKINLPNSDVIIFWKELEANTILTAP